MRLGRRAPEVAVGSGERVLAWCADAGGSVIAGTRDALYLPAVSDGSPVRVAWEDVQAADWDRDSETFRISEVGRWGERRREHSFSLSEPGRLLELVRERVTASIVFQRHVPLDPRRGVRLIARRAPRGDRPVQWIYEYDDGVDPDDPGVRRAVAAALAESRADLGL